MPPHEAHVHPDGTLTLHLGHRELLLRRRYETLSIANDLLVAVWFLVGSFLFLDSATTEAGTWLFIVGSAELAVRPVIRLSRRVHLRRVGAHESAADF
ncbi:YrhK family protein [Nocardioides sp. CFH 31398]|uniref:YrhK family protein n=1 Tax=Nocardioides sp. CFH 31398 TaxID=2919579 RepID=UPI001F06D2C4|nr:YrhK family protein [Nocardioides sp. CFH 31398]MCH1865638.1 YrhK family protein [Nocardioides sp. CFH 31398]